MPDRRKPADAALAAVAGKAKYSLCSHGATVLLGGVNDDPELFVPEINASKWGGEGWLKLWHADAEKLRGKGGKKVKDKHALKTHKGKACVETVIDGNIHRLIEGSTEWDIEWSSKSDVPSVGYVDFLLDFGGGLTFSKQLELTEEEIAAGAARPDNVINSYAVYGPMSGNILYPDGTEKVSYETGKLAHIYRPQLIAADGQTLWLDQEILTNPLRLRITLDSKWINAARFPVVLDPTIGWTSLGASYYQLVGGYVISTGRKQASSSGTITECSIGANATSGTTSTTLGAYTDSASKPSSKVCVTSGFSVTTTKQWWSSSVGSGSVTSGAYYHPAFNHDTINTLDIASDGGSGNPSSYYSASAYSAGTLPTTFASPAAYNTANWSLYLTYTEPAAGHPTIKRFGGIPYAARNRGVW